MSLLSYTDSAKGSWNKSLNFIFPTKYVIPKSLKVSHWLSEYINKQIIIYIYMYVPCNVIHQSDYPVTIASAASAMGSDLPQAVAVEHMVQTQPARKRDKCPITKK